jgi:hypothetical protein
VGRHEAENFCDAGRPAGTDGHLRPWHRLGHAGQYIAGQGIATEQALGNAFAICREMAMSRQATG